MELLPLSNDTSITPLWKVVSKQIIEWDTLLVMNTTFIKFILKYQQEEMSYLITI